MPPIDNKRPVGLLSSVSAEKFLDMVIANSPILQLCTAPKVDIPIGTYPVVSMAAYKTRGFSNAHNATTGRQTVATLQNLSAADISYNVKELVLAVNLPDSYAEDMGTTPEAIAEMFAKIYAKDLNDLLLNGDTSLTPAIENSPTDRETVLTILNGLITQLIAKGKTSAYTSSQNTINKRIVKLLDDSPADFLVNPASKIYISPADMNALWAEVDATKPIVTHRDGKLYFRGKYEIQELLHVPANHILFGDMTGLLVPLSREVWLETQRFPEARGTKAVLSSRIDCQIHPFINMNMSIPPAASSGE